MWLANAKKAIRKHDVWLTNVRSNLQKPLQSFLDVSTSLLPWVLTTSIQCNYTSSIQYPVQ